MAWHFTPYVVIFFIAAAVSAAVAVYAWRQRTVPGALQLAWLMAAGAEWSLTGGLEAAAVGIPAKVFWSQIEYIGADTGPVLFLLFALAYARPTRPLPRWVTALAWVIPIATILLAATNAWHHLIWTGFTPDTAGNNILTYHHGPWFYFAVAYFYLLIAWCAFILIREAVRRGRPYRGQTLTVVLGSVMPLATAGLYIAGLSPVPGLDISPLGFMFAGLALAWGILQFRLFDLVPVARDLLFESMGDGAVVLDVQNRIVDINPAARRLLGAEGVLIGQSARDVLAPRPDLIERYRDVMEGLAEIEWQRGPSRRLELRISPVRDRRGRSIGRLILLRDITERKRTEEALQRSNAELQASNQELDAFAHTVAHDLKTPLNVIAGYAELLTESDEIQGSADLREYVPAILRGAGKMVEIVNSLLLLANTRQENVPIAPLDTAELVAEAQRRLAHEIELRRAEITTHTTWPAAVGYGPWVEEVWVNYLSNALKYGGRPDLIPPIPPRVELAGQVQADGFVRFTIRDNGPGIAPEDQRQLFMVADRFGERRQASHGLGLSIVRRIIERMGGQVGVESVVGEGSAFYFTLPAAATVTG